MSIGSVAQSPQDRSAELDSDNSLREVRHIVAIGSGKGGVGKSTVAVNLALSLVQCGQKVGLVDSDVMGPSIPGMLGLTATEPPMVTESGKVVPVETLGLSTMSMGLLAGDDSPAILRGPMLSKYLRVLVGAVLWGKLDVLVLDLPPGTGDTQLTLAQSFKLSGAVIVTTPQDVSLKVARRGLRMFERVHVPILGIVENMSTFTCPHCGHDTDIFHRGGGELMSRELGVPYLGAIPLDAEIVTGGDEGRPVVLAHPASTSARAYQAIANNLLGRLDEHQASPLGPFRWNWETDAGKPDWDEAHVHGGVSPTSAVGMRRRDHRTLSIMWGDGRCDHFDVRELHRRLD